jgi:hypothetical protein
MITYKFVVHPRRLPFTSGPCLLARLGAHLLTYQGLGLILGQESRFRLLD